MFNDIITLVEEKKAPDEYGDLVVTKTERDVFCEVQSIGMKEFYQAHASGLQPEIKFLIADYYDYNNEQIVIYEGRRYHVLRTYRVEHELEIVCYTEVNS